MSNQNKAKEEAGKRKKQPARKVKGARVNVNPSKLAVRIVADVLKCVDAYGTGFSKGSDGNRSLVLASVLTDTAIESSMRVMERRVDAMLSVPLTPKRKASKKEVPSG